MAVASAMGTQQRAVDVGMAARLHELPAFAFGVFDCLANVFVRVIGYLPIPCEK
jgi:hypothetical protein